MNNEEPPAHEVRGETSQHSSYRLSEDSDHGRGNFSDEDGGEPFANAPHYDPTCDHSQFQFVPRLKFASVEQFKNVVVLHSVKAGACLRWVRSEPSRREVRCKDSRCKWRVYASWFRKNQSFMVRKVGLNHSCARNLRVNQAIVAWIAAYMLERFRINSEWAPGQIMDEVKLKHNIDVKRRTCYRAKVEAIKLLSGILVAEYEV
ncbi:unnamed protein product [Linum trigynum]|uniref:Transposase MuDR plant domain-containing protein n=1 Tax=Linum trigynum TaxID=586398 RepID=A0AAV2DAV5_9ROSI